MNRIVCFLLVAIACSRVQAQSLSISLIESGQSASIFGDAGTYAQGNIYWGSNWHLSGTGGISHVADVPMGYDFLGQYVSGQLSATSSTALTQSITCANLAHNANFFDRPGGFIFDFAFAENTARYEIPGGIPPNKDVWLKVAWAFHGFCNYDGWDNQFGWLNAYALGQFRTNLGISGVYFRSEEPLIIFRGNRELISGGGGVPFIEVSLPDGGTSDQNVGETWVRWNGQPIEVITSSESGVGGDQLIGHVTGWSFVSLNFSVIQAYATPAGSGPPR